MRELISNIKEGVKSRPLGCSCCLLMLSSALLLFAPSALKLSLLILAFIALPPLLFIARKVGKAKTCALFFAVLLLILGTSCTSCLLGYDLFDRRVEELAKQQESVQVDGYPSKTVYENDLSCCYLIKITKLDGKRVFGVTVLAQFSPDERPALFKMLKGSGSLDLPQSTDPSFDSASYYKSKGIFALLSFKEYDQTEKRPLDPGYPLLKMQSKVSEHIDDLLSESAAPLVKALLLGDKSRLSTPLKRDFKTLGLSHLLAVSGLHLSVLFGMWNFLFTKLRIPLKVRCFLLIPLILLFCALCSFSLSVVRAAVMLILLLLSRIVNEDSDSLTSLLFAGGLIVLLSPFSVFDVGFLLSFFATFGILQVNPLLLKKKMKEKKVRRASRALFNGLAVSIAAQVAVLPIVYLSFGSISVLSPVATLLFAPFVSLLLYLAPLALLLFFIPGLSSLLVFLTNGLCQVILRMASAARYVKEGLATTDRPLLAGFLVILTLIAAFFFLTKHKKRVAAALCAGYLLFCALCPLLPLLDPPRTLIDVNGKNDLLILYEGGESLLIDLSDGSKKSLRLSLHLLKEQTGDLNPDGLLLTHYHQRHLSSFAELCEGYYPRRLYLTPPQNEKEAAVYQGLCDLAMEEQVEVVLLEPSQALSVRSFTIKDLSRSYIKRSTHPVLSFTLIEGSKALTYLSASAPENPIPSPQSLLYLGVHGPVIKKSLQKELTEGRALLFASKDTAEAYGCPGGQIANGSLLFEQHLSSASK